VGDWACPRCGVISEPGFDLCYACGSGRDGMPPERSFRPDDAPSPEPGGRALDCLRCGQPMSFRGSQRFHEGSQAAPFLLGGLGELLVNRQVFDVHACTGCGKVELFLPDPHR
jgi:hypothetical protein